jgi:hypothetical protein
MQVARYVADALSERGQAEGEILDGLVDFGAAPCRKGFHVATHAVEVRLRLGEFVLEAGEFAAAGGDLLGDAGEFGGGERQRRPVAGRQGRSSGLAGFALIGERRLAPLEFLVAPLEFPLASLEFGTGRSGLLPERDSGVGALPVCLGRLASSADKLIEQRVVVGVEGGVEDELSEAIERNAESSVGLADSCVGLLGGLLGNAKLGLAGGELVGSLVRGPFGVGPFGAGGGVAGSGGSDEVSGQGTLADRAGVAGMAGLGGVDGGMGALDGGQGLLRPRQASGGLFREGLGCGERLP